MGNISNIILKNDFGSMTEFLSIKKDDKFNTIIINGYMYYFYNDKESMENDFKIINEKFVLLK